jgi:hypothetical protein
MTTPVWSDEQIRKEVDELDDLLRSTDNRTADWIKARVHTTLISMRADYGKRIAALTAELAQLQAQTWRPVTQGTIINTGEDGAFANAIVTANGLELDEYVTDDADTVPVLLYLPDEYALCKRQEVTE